jgi:4-carboxymuconolactone decarboxylase
MKHALYRRGLLVQKRKICGICGTKANVGNDRAKLIGVITQLIPFIGYPRALNGLRAIDEVTKS